MKTLHVLSWGGGTQSTALLLKFLKGEIKDKSGIPIKLDYAIFADTNNESQMVYKQVNKVKKYIKETYDFDIIVTKRNKELKPDTEVIKMIEQGFKYRTSEYIDLFQSHVLFFQGYLKSIDVMPFWVRDKKTGQVGKTNTKACTFAFKVDQLLKELRIREGVGRFDVDKYHINMYIGYSIDELGRVKPNLKPYAENHAPLVDLGMSKIDCIDYVIKELGFKPISSVCNMCYANDFKRVYQIYQEDKEGWSNLILLDNAMANKPTTHQIQNDVFMFRFQALDNIRLKDVNMDELNEKYRSKVHQYDIFEMEQEMACMGGCFI